MNGTKENVKAIRAIYDDITDTLFCVFKEGYDITLLDREEELDQDIYLQYAWTDKSLIAAEFWHMSKHFSELPIIIDTPFATIHVPKEVLLNDPTRKDNEIIPFDKQTSELERETSFYQDQTASLEDTNKLRESESSYKRGKHAKR